MTRLQRGSALVSVVSLPIASAPFVSSDPPPGSGAAARLFRTLAPLEEAAASRGSLAEARVEIKFHVMARAGALTIELLDGTHVVARRVAFEPRSPTDYTWAGRLLGPGEKGGDVVLTVKEDVAAGVIFAARGVYRLIPRAGKEHRLALVDPDALPDCDGAVEPSAGPLPAFAAEATPSFSDPAERIDVLIVYTPKAREEAGGTAALEATIRSAIDLTHVAYANSQIVPRLRLVHMEEIDHREARHFSTDLFWVRDDPQVNALRDRYGADMVALVVHNLSGCGTGFLMSEPGLAFAPNAYQVTAWDCAGANLTMPHEFAHIQGADHNPEDAPGYPSGAAYRWSYGHYVDGKYRTVLSYSEPCLLSCPRRPYFSNPSIVFDGAPTGVAGDRENYRTLNDTAIYVANFRPAAASCGNGWREEGETCDGVDVGGSSCADFGCTGPGSLGCSATCDRFDLSACSECPFGGGSSTGDSGGSYEGWGGASVGSGGTERRRSSS